MSFAPTEAHIRNMFETNAFEAIDPDVRWVIANEEGACVPGFSMQGVFNLAEWMEKVFTPLRARLTSPPKAEVIRLYITGMTAIVEIKGTATQKNGEPYNNSYCWILTFSPDTGKIVEIHEYLDTAMLRDVLQNNKVEG
ncbi:hypothetical protein BD626DRAFT_495497 [Schizophyllum amplum]|uniref:SnoaL-like domain-containing protein n=1 Tax=Schizophyllum amplum TaxID=97359 RepID=A0A550CE70_9AGAR|nr:hypothetical protein BD626DRAFT_495497 [Auriculariopsis ampla]